MNILVLLVWLRFRRDRIQLIAWIALFAVFALIGNAAVEGTYGTPNERAGVVAIVIQTPSVLMLRGTPQGVEADAFQYFLLFAFLGVMVGLMSTFLAVRHSRAEEESGRAELVGATRAGRIVPLLATTIEGVTLNLVVGAISALGYQLGGAGPANSWLAGVALAAVGIVFLGVGLLCAQIMRTSRGANGLAAALVALAYALRAAGDASGTVHADGLSMTAGWPSWLSPIGWGQLVAPFSNPTVWPVAASLALGAALFGASALLQSHRDIDSSIIPERLGRLTAHRTLSGPIGLTARLLRNPIAGWMVAGGLFGLLIGSLGETMVQFVQAGAEGAAGIENTVGNTLSALAGPNAHGSIIDLFTVAMFSLVGALAAVASVQAVLRARQDEAGGAAEILLAAPLSRVRWFLGYVLIGVVSIVLVVGVAVLGAVIGLQRSEDSWDRAAVVVQAGLAQLPAAAALLAAVALAFALLPRFTIGLGWAILLAAIFIGQFGGFLGLPGWARDASPFSHTPVVTAADVDWAPAWVMLAVAIVAAGLATVLVRRRDVALGA
ncbi:ABC transporter permease [Luethyella okanaganae]|uniref:ABC transporter permease n=1 Tax=Luethyella okanaganae TaxID=69372 RepID=A0ABW1VF36_9MICO